MKTHQNNFKINEIVKSIKIIGGYYISLIFTMLIVMNTTSNHHIFEYDISNEK